MESSGRAVYIPVFSVSQPLALPPGSRPPDMPACFLRKFTPDTTLLRMENPRPTMIFMNTCSECVADFVDVIGTADVYQ